MAHKPAQHPAAWLRQARRSLHRTFSYLLPHLMPALFLKACDYKLRYKLRKVMWTPPLQGVGIIQNPAKLCCEFCSDFCVAFEFHSTHVYTIIPLSSSFYFLRHPYITRIYTTWIPYAPENRVVVQTTYGGFYASRARHTKLQGNTGHGTPENADAA